MVNTRAQAKFLGESFLRFQMLPAELRIQIWNEAMPRHGVFPVQLVIEKTSYAMIKLRLKPTQPNERDPAFSERISTTRSLLIACRESNVAVGRNFSDSIRYRGNEMRFNAEKDLIFIPWDASQLESMRLNVFSSLPTTFKFAGAWNTVVRRLSIESHMVYSSFGALYKRLPSYQHYQSARIINNFMRFLRNFTSLRQLALTAPGLITARRWDVMCSSLRRDLRDGLRDSHNSGMMKHRPKHVLQLRRSVLRLAEGARCLKAVIDADPMTKDNAYAELGQHALYWTLPPRHRIKFGYPEFSHLDVVGMVHLDPELKDRGICREMEFE